MQALVLASSKNALLPVYFECVFLEDIHESRIVLWVGRMRFHYYPIEVLALLRERLRLTLPAQPPPY